jgi:TldD protein
MNVMTPNRLGASSAYASTVDRRPLVASASSTRVLNPVVTVGVVTPNRGIDADFLDLPRHQLADAALSAATAAGASHADLRIHRLTTEMIQLRDGELETAVLSRELGLAIRVIVDGTWGFASHAELSPTVAADTARRAVWVATTLAELNTDPVELAPEPVYRDVTWVSNYRIDPFAVTTADKIDVLDDYSGRLLAADGVDHVSAGLNTVKEQIFYADTFGSSITQQRVRLLPVLEAVTIDPGGCGFDSMRTLVPPMGRGWEVLAGDEVWNWTEELAQLPSQLAEKIKAPSVTPGPTDLVIDPTNLWLTIHESIGHATEYDRAIGYESAYAGTSFATPDKLGSLRYGSPAMNVTADRTVEFGLASVGYDDEGVAAQSWDLVRDGIFVGYQLDRVFAPRLGLPRSNGCSYADSPHHVPIQRMPNVSLQPSPEDRSTADLISRVDDGIYIVGDRSWSIDMQRYNFQFTGQRFYRIRNGRLDGQVRDVAYQATTIDFWNSMEAVGGSSTWRLGGAYNCGKAQPGQVAAVSHGCPSALFRGVNVLNARIEAGE